MYFMLQEWKISLFTQSFDNARGQHYNNTQIIIKNESATRPLF